MSGDRIQIVVADDHPLFRHGLCKLLEVEPDMAVVAEAADGAEALQAVVKHKPNALLLDMTMPRLPGMEVLRKLERLDSTTKVIVLTVAIEKAQMVEAFDLGARGVMLKDAAMKQVIQCLRAVMAGQFWIGREGVADIMQHVRELQYQSQTESGRSPYRLTAREREIISCILAGSSNKDIAEKFSISEATVKRHLSNIYEKVPASNRLELALFAIEKKLS